MDGYTGVSVLFKGITAMRLFEKSLISVRAARLHVTLCASSLYAVEHSCADLGKVRKRKEVSVSHT